MNRVTLLVALLLPSLALAQFPSASRQWGLIKSGSSPSNAVTQEAIAITVNPTSGTDSTASGFITTQAQATARGAFASIGGALSWLPPAINTAITITIADGSYTVVGATFFGDWSRFTYGATGRITVTSTSKFVRASGAATTYALSAGSSTGCTFSSDPGFSANAYRGYFIRVASGTGVNSIATVTTHTTTAWSIAGTWSGTAPNNTSTVEILDDAVTLTFSDAAATRIQIAGGFQKAGPDNGANTLTFSSNNVEMIGLSLTPTNAVIIDVNGMRLGWVGRSTKVEWDFSGSALFTALAFFDGGGSSGTGLLDRGGSLFLGAGTIGSQLGSSTYIRNFTSRGIQLINSQAPRSGLPMYISLSQTQIDACSQGVNIQGNGSEVFIGANVSGSNTTYGIVVNDRASARFGTSPAMTLTGSTADILMDGVIYSVAEVVASPGEFIAGQKNAVVGFDGSGAFTGNLTPTIRPLSSTTSVDWNTTGKTTLFTVPTGKTAVITSVVIRSPSAAVVGATCGLGRNANANDYFASTNFTGLSGATVYEVLMPTTAAGGVLGAAADTFGTKCSVAQGTALTVTIDVFGYLL